jgi:hypothetical protein
VLLRPNLPLLLELLLLLLLLLLISTLRGAHKRARALKRAEKGTGRFLCASFFLIVEEGSEIEPFRSSCLWNQR